MPLSLVVERMLDSALRAPKGAANPPTGLGTVWRKLDLVGFWSAARSYNAKRGAA